MGVNKGFTNAYERSYNKGLSNPHLIALYHFALQATLLEMFGPDFVDEAFLDRHLDWLERWRRQCEAEEPGVCSF